ncbi:MAG: hypothetical protein PHE02_12445 [Lachnospiraceae bacterium]|nr:hypothetical protein [Lachnospiraceae bacterium]
MFQNIVQRFGRSFLLCHTAIWFAIGFLISCFFKIVPLLNQIEFLVDAKSLASLFGLILGFGGGVLLLVRLER